MSDELRHECAVAMVVLRRLRPGGDAAQSGDFGGTKLSLLLEKQHNRGQDGAGAAILAASPEPGEAPYWIAKSASATPLADVLAEIGRRGAQEGRVFLGHLRYATFGKNDASFCHPFVHQSSELEHTLLLAGNFNLTNAPELFDDYRRHGEFPTSKADGYLVCELIAKELMRRREYADGCVGSLSASASLRDNSHTMAVALSSALAGADGAWTLCGMTGDGWAFATRDPHGIRPGYYYIDDDVAVVASERPAIQAAFDVPPEAVKELPPGQALVVSPAGETTFESLGVSKFEGDMANDEHNLQTLRPLNPRTFKPLNPQTFKPSNLQTFESSNLRTFEPSNLQAFLPVHRPCSFERIYFSRANDADIHRERKALGAALLPQILEAADTPMEDIFFSYIPNSARIAFHGLLEELFAQATTPTPTKTPTFPRFGEIAVKDAKFRTFIADAASRQEFYKHVYDVTYGLVRPGRDTLVVLDDSIVRGNTMRNAILPMLDRLGPRRIVVASSAPPIRYPDCYGIDMSTLGELVAFRALVNLLDGERGTGNGERGTGNGERVLHEALGESPHVSTCSARLSNPLAPLYARFTDAEHCAEIARLLTPPGMKAEVRVVFQTVENLRRCLKPPNCQTTKPPDNPIGDWYFTGDYPTPGGHRVLRKALENYLDGNVGRSY